jgi:NAD(P)-dependent dehydrogenase (short-subunit alcohol dehydrogenase family)
MKPILVTGGGRGLGAELCRSLAASGHDVVVHYNTSEKEAKEVAEACKNFKIQAETIQGNFSSMQSLSTFLAAYLDRFPNTKGLINNVGNYLIAPSLETSIMQWKELFETNFFAPLQITCSLLPSIIRQKGSIVNIGVSGLRGQRAFTQSTAYAATKSALLFYTISLAKELASKEVRVNMVSPGFMENAVDLPDFSALPLKRPAFLKEVAQVVGYFFDSKNAYITGQNIEVAGGVGLA